MSTPTVNPKSAQFKEEMSALLKKYQYQMIPELQITQTGIVPILAVRDVVPPKDVPENPPVGSGKPEPKKKGKK